MDSIEIQPLRADAALLMSRAFGLGLWVIDIALSHRRQLGDAAAGEPTAPRLRIGWTLK
jgi:hypothetical protein